LLVECLIEQGVTHAFGVPGESYLAVLDGFHAYRDQIQFVINRQEGGAAYMADAQGRLSGRPGVCFVTRGPGATNASVGIHTAFQDSTPMVLFVGDVGSDFRDREAFQEVDYFNFFGPSTRGMAKRVERIDDPERVPEYVARAFATAMRQMSERIDIAKLKSLIEIGKPFLGICVGMQAMASVGMEFETVMGMDVFENSLVDLIDTDLNLPHVGWNSVKIVRESPLFQDLADESDFYFVHSYGYKKNSGGFNTWCH